MGMIDWAKPDCDCERKKGRNEIRSAQSPSEQDLSSSGPKKEGRWQRDLHRDLILTRSYLRTIEEVKKEEEEER